MITAESPVRKAPARCHRLVRHLFEEMMRQNATYGDVALRSGVHFTTMRHWRYHNGPTVANLDACLNALGYELVVRKIKA